MYDTEAYMKILKIRFRAEDFIILFVFPKVQKSLPKGIIRM